jgi:small subunit ribosomal protein S2
MALKDPAKFRYLGKPRKRLDAPMKVDGSAKFGLDMRVPGMLFVVDPSMEAIAVEEAQSLKLPIVAMCDTDADPDKIDFPIPSNDDAIRSIQLMAGRIADAVLEGLAYGEVEQEAAAAATAPTA